jgi:glucokinase
MKTFAEFHPFLLQVLEALSVHGEVPLDTLAQSVDLEPEKLKAPFRMLAKEGAIELRDGGEIIELHREYAEVVGIDLGASHLHFAAADYGGALLREFNEKIRPEDGPAKLISQIRKGIHRLAPRRGQGPFRALAIGVPSPVNPQTGLAAFASNLPGWRNIDLNRALEEEFRVPISIENDANVAAIGEHWRGVARGWNNFVFIALGTGIGSGIFVDGKLYRGRAGAAGEIQRLHVEWPRWQEDFGDVGYFESLASGQGIAAQGRKTMRVPAGKRSLTLAEARDARFVFDAFRKGDAGARAALEKIFTILGVGIANIVSILDPNLIVLGGGVARGAPEFMLSTVRTVVKRILAGAPPIELSSLEDKAQTYGAIRSAISLVHREVLRRLGQKS